MKAEIIAVGSELLTPDRIDTNSLFLTEELNKLGIEVVRKTVVGDDRALLLEAFRDAVNRVPLTIASGGLGPTSSCCPRSPRAYRSRCSRQCWRGSQLWPPQLGKYPPCSRGAMRV